MVLIVAMKIEIDVGAIRIIIDSGFSDTYRIEHVMGALQIGQLVKIRGTTVHRLKMGVVGLAYVQSVKYLSP